MITNMNVNELVVNDIYTLIDLKNKQTILTACDFADALEFVETMKKKGDKNSIKKFVKQNGDTMFVIKNKGKFFYKTLKLAIQKNYIRKNEKDVVIYKKSVFDYQFSLEEEKNN